MTKGAKKSDLGDRLRYKSVMDRGWCPGGGVFYYVMRLTPQTQTRSLVLRLWTSTRFVATFSRALSP